MSCRFRRPPLAVLGPLFGLLSNGCQSAAPATPPPTFTLKVVVSSDLSIPQDLDGVDFIASLGPQILRRETWVLGSASSSLPHIVTLRAHGAPTSKVHLLATGYRKGAPVVLGEANVAVREGASRTVRLPLSFLCFGAKSVAGVDPDGAVRGTCGLGQTCRGDARTPFLPPRRHSIPRSPS